MERIIEIIYNSFPSEQRPAQVGDITISPSMLSDCKRKIFYNKTGAKQSNPIELPSLLKMRWGNILHEDIQSILSKAGILESHEELKTIEYDGLTFRYKYDGLINDNGDRYMFECKTVYASGYKSIEEKPKDEHVLQLISYMVFEKISKGILLYAGRDNGYLKQHRVQLITNDDGSEFVTVNFTKTNFLQEWKDKLEEMKVVKSQIENNILPDKDYAMYFKNVNGVIVDEFQKDSVKYKSAWQCSYCGFRDLCWAQELEQMKSNKFYINNQFFN